MTETTEDLVKRLRRVSMDLGVPSTTTLDSKVVADAADRIEALEAKLEKAEETLKMVCGQISVGDDGPDETWADFSFKQTDQIFSTLAELTGGKDD